jgi:hypothetical protein
MAPTAPEASLDPYLMPSKSNLSKKTIPDQQEQQQSTHMINRDQSSPCSIPTALHAWDDADAPTPDRRNISSTSTIKILQQQRLQEQRDLSLPTFPMITSARPSTLNTTIKQLKFYMAGKEGGVDTTISPSSPDNSRVKSASTVQINKQWSFSERFFYSRDDESVVVSGQPSWDSSNDLTYQPSLVQQNLSFPVALSIDGADGDRDRGDDDETCNNTIQKARKRSKKVSRASTVNAFVIFLKALFGVGMLSNPAVLGEVGLLLGTYCHLLIVIGCAFACYLLLTARQFAKIEVMENQRRGEEMRENYEVWRIETERRAAVQMRIQEEMESNQTLQQNKVSAEITFNCTAAMVQDRLTLPVVSTVGSFLSDDECIVDPMPLSTDKKSRSYTSVNKISRSNFDATSSHGRAQRIGSQDFLNSASSDNKGVLHSATDEYQILSDHSFMPPPMPPPKLEQVRLITYGDVAKYLVGKQASMFIVFAMVTGHIMFASGLLHLAIENLCYVVGWERLGWSYTQVYVEEDTDDRFMMRRLGHSQDDGGEHNNPNHSNDHASRSSDEEEYYFEWKGPDFIGKIPLRSTALLSHHRYVSNHVLS